MQVRESVRSGRRENFYTTDNSFIDHYARKLQATDIAVYHTLERYANCHTRSTWVGTAKIAEVLNVSQRTVQRSLKALEELKLIRIVQTSTVKMYFVLPVPPRPKAASTPLFDKIEDEEFLLDDVSVAIATRESESWSRVSPAAPRASSNATAVAHCSDINDGAYKEEQDSLNKTQEQDLFNKGAKPATVNLEKTAQRILDVLGLPGTSMSAAIAAVEAKTRNSNLSEDGLLQELFTAANHARRRGVEADKFIDDFLAEHSAGQIVEALHLPATNSLVVTVKAAVKAEASYTKRKIEEVQDLITNAAIDDRQRGITIDRFYFENVKWRSNASTSKAEKRKLDNLAASARARELLRHQRH